MRKALVVVSVLAALAVASLGVLRMMGNRVADVPTTAQRSTTSPAIVEPDEPCRVEAPPAGRAAAQNWCGDGVFTRVNVSNDADNFVVLLQFSRKGLRAWTSNRLDTLNRFRGLTDEMVVKTDMNVAFSLHDTNGDLVGGCARKRGARESTCN